MESNTKRLGHILIAYIQTKFWRKFGSRLELEAHQRQLWEKHSKKITQTSPFYRSYIGKPLEQFPIMNKSLMMENFDSLNTKGLFKNDCMDIALKSEESRDFSPMIDQVSIGLSSGTSGNRGLFLADSHERARWAGIILAKALPQTLRHKQKIALFLRANNNLYNSLSSQKIQFEFYDLQEKQQTHIDRLNQYNPSVLVAPPSMLRMLAKAYEQKCLNISPHRIFSAAEVLDPIDELYLSQIFKQKIHQLYQCTEGFLAASCPYGTLHLNEDFIIFEKEWVNKEKNKFIPIITDLERSTQPIIRYRLNDVLSIRMNPCPCGSASTALEQIEGRADDIFYFKNFKQETQAIFPDYLRRRILQADENIEEYRLLQHSVDLLEIQIKGGSTLKVKEQLQLFFKKQNLEFPNIDFTTYQDHVGLRKMKRVERLFTPHEVDILQ